MSKAEPNFFATAVNDDSRLFVGHQLPPSAVVDLIRIYSDTAFFGRELKQTQFWPVRVFGHKFGIECNQSGFVNMITKLVEC